MKFLSVMFALLLSVCLFAEDMWNVHELRSIPQIYTTNEPINKEKSWAYDEILTDTEKEYDKTNDNVRAIYYKGLDYKGKPTRVFAYIGVPDHPKDTKVPGIVLVHGGGGSAFEAWVRKWNAMGYAAIAMDNYGCKSTLKEKGEPSGFGGPDNYFNYNDDVKDQWPYHAVANIVLAGTILGNLDGVDKNNIGVTGISWGGYLTCIASSIDDRFRFAIPVYGSGFLYDYSPTVEQNDEILKKWISNWDPRIYLKNTKVPITWIVSNTDYWYWLLGVKKSYDVTMVVDKKLVIIDNWTHGHIEPANINEPISIANEYTQNKVIMPKILTGDFKNGAVEFGVNIKTDRVVCYWTQDENPKGDPSGDPKKGTKWNSFPVEYTGYTGIAVIPANAKVFYLNAFSKDGLQASTQIFTVENK